MHFQRARRQRFKIREYGRFDRARAGSQASWTASSLSKRAPLQRCSVFEVAREYSRSYLCCSSGARIRMYTTYISGTHQIRNESLLGPIDEKRYLNLYFESNGDPWMRERIAKWCTTYPNMRHLTERYLDRMYKIRLFL